MEKYDIHDLSDLSYSYDYITGDGRPGSSKTINVYIYPEWAIAYDGTGNYTDVAENFYIPEGETPARLTEFNEIFDNVPGYEWRGLHTTLKYYTNNYYFNWDHFDYHKAD